MSKRFGRNQRRKMRAELELQQSIIDCKSYLIADQHKTIGKIQGQCDQLQDEIKRARNIVGNMCVLFAPEKFEGIVDHISNTVRIAIKKPLKWSCELEILLTTPPALNILSLEVMIAMVEERHWNNMKHVVVKYGYDKRWGYAISRDALHQIPKQESVRMITQQLAQQIMKEL